MSTLLGSLLRGAWNATKFGANVAWGTTKFATKTGAGVVGAVFNRETLSTGMGLAQGAFSIGKLAHKYQAPIGLGIAAGAVVYGAMTYPSPQAQQYAEVGSASQRFKASASGDIVFGLNRVQPPSISLSEAAYLLI